MNEKTTIAFLGDTFLGDNPRVSLSPQVNDIFKSADLVVANLESPLTKHECSTYGKICLRSAPKTAKILKSWHIDLVSLANNHIFDYGLQGFEDTCHALSESGISYIGAGKNLAEASNPKILDVNHLKIGFLSYSCRYHKPQHAKENAFGVAPFSEQLVISQVKYLNKKADLVIVQPHWGFGEYDMPVPKEMVLGAKILEAGADAVIGHHAHVVQGIRRFGNKIIAYNLGDFIFQDYMDRGSVVHPHGENLEGIVLLLHLRKDGISDYQVFFTLQQNLEVVLDNTSERTKKFTRRCDSLSSSNYPAAWRRCVTRYIIHRILYWINIFNWRKIDKNTIAGIWKLTKFLFSSRGKNKENPAE